MIVYVLMRELSVTLKVAAGVQGAITSPPQPMTCSASTAKGNSAGGGVANERGSSEKAAKRGSNPYLVDHSQLPGWAQDNAWIIKGHRRPGGTQQKESLRSFDHGTVYKCWRSVWAYWHNETGKHLPSILLVTLCSSPMQR